MSRNRSLRDIADDLPVTFKVDKLGRKMYNSYGVPIHTDHFQEMLDIKYAIKKKYHNQPVSKARISKEQMQAIGKYGEAVYEHGRKMRIKRIQKWVSAISATIAIIYLAVKHFFK